MMKKPLYKLVHALYNGATDRLPQKVQDQKYLLAAGLGYGGSRGLVETLRWTSEHIVDKVLPGFDAALPYMEDASKAALILSVGYVLSQKETISTWMEDHKVYMAGMAGSVAGSLQQAMNDGGFISWF